MTAIDVSLLPMDFFVVAAMHCVVAKVAAVAAAAGAADIDYVDESDNSSRHRPMAAHNEALRSRRATRSSRIAEEWIDVRHNSYVDDCKPCRLDRNVHVQAPSLIVVRIADVRVNDFRVLACHGAVVVGVGDAATVDIRGMAAHRRAGGVEWVNSSGLVIDLIRLMAATRDCRISLDRNGATVKRTRSYFAA